MKINLLGKIIILLAVLEIVSIVASAASELTYLESSRIVFGSVYVLFLPGWIWSFVFFPRNRFGEGIDSIERIALSFALSIAIVPLVVFYLNLIGLKINALSSFFVVLVLSLAGAGIIFWKRKRSRHYI